VVPFSEFGDGGEGGGSEGFGPCFFVDSSEGDFEVFDGGGFGF